MPRVLWIDEQRDSWAEALAADGLDVTRVTAPAEGWQHLASEAFHLVICRLGIPERGAFVARVRAERPETEVLVLTDAPERAPDDCALLTTPTSLPALRRAVRASLERFHHRTCAEARRIEAPTLTWGAPAMRPVVETLGRLATTDATVWLHGEAGVGKRTAALGLHAWSARADGPFEVVRCGGRPAAEVAADLFGEGRRRGRAELAAEGTLYLAGVDDLSPELQAMLTRVVQDGRFCRVGGSWTIDATARLVVGSRRDLAELAQTGAFREDLAYRLGVFPVSIPPLRGRREDVLPLARTLLASIAAESSRPAPTLEPAAEAALLARSWPGNVRELRVTLARAALLAEGGTLGPAWLTESALRATAAPAVPRSLQQVERDAVAAALTHVDGNRRKAATLLGIGERTLYDKIRRYGLG